MSIRSTKFRLLQTACIIKHLFYKTYKTNARLQTHIYRHQCIISCLSPLMLQYVHNARLLKEQPVCCTSYSPFIIENYIHPCFPVTSVAMSSCSVPVNAEGCRFKPWWTTGTHTYLFWKMQMQLKLGALVESVGAEAEEFAVGFSASLPLVTILIKAYWLPAAEIVFLYVAYCSVLVSWLITELMVYWSALLWTQLECTDSKVMNCSPCSSVLLLQELPRRFMFLLLPSTETGALKFISLDRNGGQKLSFHATSWQLIHRRTCVFTWQ